MKKTHLICNAHIDPVWLWNWQEGVAAAIATFQSAVNLAEEYDYIFCHNEAVLYQHIETYAPELFEKIRELVKKGKWHIMGGWFLQPDCNMPSGESIVRQIQLGHQYFQEKFGVVPTTAINFDPFGHSRGLVQIMRKCGQDSYLFMRPYPRELSLPAEQFLWEGYDGSVVKANRLVSGYNTPLGQAVDCIKRSLEIQPQPVVAITWGVGNHGGGPSRKDLSDIARYMQEASQEGNLVIHSTPEAFWAETNPTDTFAHSLHISMPGCYVSMSRVKRAHAQLENQLYLAEKICSLASAKGLMEYPAQKLRTATEDLLNSEFHDILPGTCIPEGENNGLSILQHGLLETEQALTKAFFALMKEEDPAEPGTYPIFVFNPHPYTLTTQVACEFILADQNWNRDTETHLTLYDRVGNQIPCQCIKEACSLNLDWRKKIVFPCKLEPMSLNRFIVRTELGPLKEKESRSQLVFNYNDMTVEIDEHTGLLKRYAVGGVEYLHDAFLPVSFSDNADPWAMSTEQLKQIGSNPREFSLCAHPDGVFSGLRNISVIEDGDVMTAVEALFEQDHSKVRIVYHIYKDAAYVDVDVTVFWQGTDQILRLALPLSQSGQYIGQVMYGTEDLYMDGRENVSHRFSAVKQGEDCLAVLNDGTYGSMFRDNTVYVSLLRGVAYAAHPIEDRPLLREDRYIPRLDQGEHTYHFRITKAKVCELERLAQEFNQPPYAIHAFPVSVQQTPAVPLKVETDNVNIVLTAMKKAEDSNALILRLINNQDMPASTSLTFGTEKIFLSFGRYEVKTVRYDGSLTEIPLMVI